ncbi:hypothetical protein AOQ84DRAFT_413648 [Glonium stellatum]|uniref:Transmembrane protein n=1 Tax=Glonium stellatum TaxID=574774 RepID=A0A8E2EUZ0_9PEZI|nr:hypothetical protein AOQ84DRAFT_413648 [Glonium stellatum]
MAKSEAKKNPDTESTRKRCWQMVKGPLIRIVGLLWLAPAIALLWLNFKSYIVGAALGCHGSGCRLNPFSFDQATQSQRLDRRNHDILNALQFVAKGMEVWFMFIAASLVYNVAVRLAKTGRLPLDMLTMYFEFVSLKYLLDIVLKCPCFGRNKKELNPDPTPQNGTTGTADQSNTAQPNAPQATHDIAAGVLRPTDTGVNAEPNDNSDIGQTKRLESWLKVIILVFVAVLCLVTNLMGIATAVLALPSLQWITINQQKSIVFGDLISSSPPSDPSITSNCTTSALNAGNYTCTYALYAESLDQMVAGSLSSNAQQNSEGALQLPPVLQEGSITSTVNISGYSNTIWTPSRQLLRSFSADLTNWYYSVINNKKDPLYPESSRFNQSLQAQLQRTGPTIGILNECTKGTTNYIYNVSDNQQIYCFPLTNNTKCIRWGSGWGDNSSSASIMVGDVTSNNATLSIQVYATQQAVRLDFDSCASNGTCDWNATFSAPPDEDKRNISSSQLSFVYYSPTFAPNTTVFCSTTSYLSFANYVLNPSPVENILNLAQLEVLNDSPTVKPYFGMSGIADIHPDWLLMAWSVRTTHPVVSAARAAAVEIIQAFENWMRYGGGYRFDFTAIHNDVAMQAVSFITYTTSTAEASLIAQRGEELLHANPPPALSSGALVQLWTYGTTSHTSKLGFVVMLLGCVFVLIHTAAYVEEKKSLTTIVVAALRNGLPPHYPPVDEETGAPLNVTYARPKLPGRNSSFSFSPGTSPAGYRNGEPSKPD